MKLGFGGPQSEKAERRHLGIIARGSEPTIVRRMALKIKIASRWNLCFGVSKSRFRSRFVRRIADAFDWRNANADSDGDLYRNENMSSADLSAPRRSRNNTSVPASVPALLQAHTYTRGSARAARGSGRGPSLESRKVTAKGDVGSVRPLGSIEPNENADRSLRPRADVSAETFYEQLPPACIYSYVPIPERPATRRRRNDSASKFKSLKGRGKNHRKSTPARPVEIRKTRTSPPSTRHYGKPGVPLAQSSTPNRRIFPVTTEPRSLDIPRRANLLLVRSRDRFVFPGTRPDSLPISSVAFSPPAPRPTNGGAPGRQSPARQTRPAESASSRPSTRGLATGPAACGSTASPARLIVGRIASSGLPTPT